MGYISNINGAFQAIIFLRQNSVYTALATANLPTFAGTGALRFEVKGNELKLFVDNVLKLVTYNSAITTAGTVGIRGTNAIFDNFSAINLLSQTTTLPFTDTFTNLDNSELDTVWTERVGAFAIQANQAATAVPGVNIATLNTAPTANVSVQAKINLAASGARAALLARYSGPGENNFYMGYVANSGGAYQAYIYLRQNGAYTALATANLPTFTGAAGTLRFEVNGNQLKLFVNNVLQLVTYDSAITAAGQVGIRGTNATFDDFNAASVVSLPASLPFNDTFTKPNNSELDRTWTECVGAFSIQNNQAATADPSVNIATLNNIAVANVVVQTDISVTASGARAGLMARYTGPAEDNFYLGYVSNNNGVYQAVIFLRRNGVYTLLAMNNLPSFTGTGTIRFEAVGTSLKLFVNNVLQASATDSMLTTGSVGIRGTNAKFGNFTAS
jgi:hypothetical protein